MNAPKRSVISSKSRFLCIISGCNHQTFIKTIYILDNVTNTIYENWYKYSVWIWVFCVEKKSIKKTIYNQIRQTQRPLCIQHLNSFMTMETNQFSFVNSIKSNSKEFRPFWKQMPLIVLNQLCYVLKSSCTTMSSG